MAWSESELRKFRDLCEEDYSGIKNRATIEYALKFIEEYGNPNTYWNDKSFDSIFIKKITKIMTNIMGIDLSEWKPESSFTLDQMMQIYNYHSWGIDVAEKETSGERRGRMSGNIDSDRLIAHFYGHKVDVVLMIASIVDDREKGQWLKNAYSDLEECLEMSDKKNDREFRLSKLGQKGVIWYEMALLSRDYDEREQLLKRSEDICYNLISSGPDAKTEIFVRTVLSRSLQKIAEIETDRDKAKESSDDILSKQGKISDSAKGRYLLKLHDNFVTLYNLYMKNGEGDMEEEMKAIRRLSFSASYAMEIALFARSIKTKKKWMDKAIKIKHKSAVEMSRGDRATAAYMYSYTGNYSKERIKLEKECGKPDKRIILGVARKGAECLRAAIDIFRESDEEETKENYASCNSGLGDLMCDIAVNTGNEGEKITALNESVESSMIAGNSYEEQGKPIDATYAYYGIGAVVCKLIDQIEVDEEILDKCLLYIDRLIEITEDIRRIGFKSFERNGKDSERALEKQYGRALIVKGDIIRKGVEFGIYPIERLKDGFESYETGVDIISRFDVDHAMHSRTYQARTAFEIFDETTEIYYLMRGIELNKAYLNYFEREQKNDNSPLRNKIRDVTKRREEKLEKIVAMENDRPFGCGKRKTKRWRRQQKRERFLRRMNSKNRPLKKIKKIEKIINQLS